jgi:hypothetical protein
MSDNQEVMWDLLCTLTGEQVARVLTNYHGMQLLDVGFWKYLIAEGYLEEEEEDDEQAV